MHWKVDEHRGTVLPMTYRGERMSVALRELKVRIASWHPDGDPRKIEVWGRWDREKLSIVGPLVVEHGLPVELDALLYEARWCLRRAITEAERLARIARACRRSYRPAPPPAPLPLFERLTAGG
jgi:hypothetical protein